MNSDGMPYWLRSAIGRVSRWYAQHYRLALCDSYGKGVHIESPRYLNISGGGVRIGAGVAISAQPDAQVHLSCWPYHTDTTPTLTISDYCSLSPGVRLIAAQNIHLEPGCILAAQVYVTDADWHGRYHRVFPPGPCAPVRLERNVWLADRVTVLKGVTIGANTIVGAGAVVVDDLPANCIAAGNPAQVVAQLDPAAPRTDRQALFEELGFNRFSEEFWRARLAGNSFGRWAVGLLWPAARRSQRLRS